MYLYAEEKLKKDLEEQRNLKEPYEKELNEVCEKLDCIDSYADLDNDQFNNYCMGILCIVIGGACSGISAFGLIKIIFGLLKSINWSVNLILIALNLIGAFFLWGASIYVKSGYSNGKEKRILKEKGVKEFKKQQHKLLDRKLELEKEIASIQSKTDKIVKILEHISFFKETINDSFYLADSKEDYARISLENNESYKMYLENEEDYIRELKLENNNNNNK